MALLMSLMSGTMYAFGAFEMELKSRMKWRQSDIQLMGVSMHVGTYLMKPFCGAILDSCGVRVAASIAASLSLLGYGVVSLCVADTRFGNVALMAFCFYLVGIASAEAYVTSLSVSIGNFQPEVRGKVVGAIASMFGISATFVSLIFSYGFKGKILTLTLTLTLESSPMPFTHTCIQLSAT